MSSTRLASRPAFGITIHGGNGRVTITLKEAALEYQARGLSVFPCKPGLKAPMGSFAPHGRNSATRSRSLIEKWWTEEPSANIGIPTGPESGWLVLDMDWYREGTGIAALQLQKLIGFLPPTRRASTPQGGEHWLFQWPGEDFVHKARLAEGLDVKGAGGYIVAPPSMNEHGVPYQVIWPEDEVAELPEAWLALLVRGSDDPLNPPAQRKLGE